MSTYETLAQTRTDHTVSRTRAMRIGANAVIIGLWLWLYRPVLAYLAIIFSREDFRTNQLVLVGMIVLIAIQMRKGHLHPQYTVESQTVG